MVPKTQQSLTLGEPTGNGQLALPTASICRQIMRTVKGSRGSRGGRGKGGAESTVNTLAELLVDINILQLIIGRLQQESLHSPDLIMPLN